MPVAVASPDCFPQLIEAAHCAPQLSEALGYIPSLCVVGGPEFGSTATGCLVGGYTTSSVIFGGGIAPDADAFGHVSHV